MIRLSISYNVACRCDTSRCSWLSACSGAAALAAGASTFVSSVAAFCARSHSAYDCEPAKRLCRYTLSGSVCICSAGHIANHGNTGATAGLPGLRGSNDLRKECEAWHLLPILERLRAHMRYVVVQSAQQHRILKAPRPPDDFSQFGLLQR